MRIDEKCEVIGIHSWLKKRYRRVPSHQLLSAILLYQTCTKQTHYKKNLRLLHTRLMHILSAPVSCAFTSRFSKGTGESRHTNISVPFPYTKPATKQTHYKKNLRLLHSLSFFDAYTTHSCGITSASVFTSR